MTSDIVILTGNHLCNNPRVIKEATTLTNAGYDVTVLGAWFDSALKRRDSEMQASLPFNFQPSIDSTENAVRRLGLRIKAKIGVIAHRFGRIENRYQLGYACDSLSCSSLRRVADLCIAHSEPAMSVAVDLLGTGRRVGVDMEDWYSEDLQAEARKSRPTRLLRSLEEKLLNAGAHTTCPSRAMSEALAREFGCQPPTVVYNAFPWRDRNSIDGHFHDRRDLRRPSIHWFSQTLGGGRGLEDLIAALPLVKEDAELHLRGEQAVGFDRWLADRVPESWRERVVIHGPVPNADLLSRISEHDIGFAGETARIRSRNLTVTNKILYYLLAGLAVVASDTAGQREVAELAPGALLLYPSGDAAALADRLSILLRSGDARGRARVAALNAAERTFSWERQEKTLLESVNRSLRFPTTSVRI